MVSIRFDFLPDLLKRCFALGVFFAGAALVVVFLAQPESADPEPSFEASRVFYHAVGMAPDIRQSPPMKKGSYTVQLGIYDSEEDLKGLLQKLITDGHEAFYTPFYRNGKVYYSLCAGVYGEMAGARVSSKTLAKAYELKGKVIRL